MIDLTIDQESIIHAILKATVPDCEVMVFGSRISQHHKKYSDLDLAVRGIKRLSLLQLFELKEKFAESSLHFRVDISDWNAFTPEFQKVISSHLVKIQ
jgi:predicted nucleotidyltransferase